ncbi:MAG: 3-methyladenine DNA glycosylase AlkC [Planctomycetota bacterium]|jgi:3-methyladenine DNA glycosylase AlkC
MAEYTPLKDAYDQAYIDRLALTIKAACPDFDAKDFKKIIFADAWDDLELKARMERIAEVIDLLLPQDLSAAFAVVDQVVENFDGYMAMFFPAFVEIRGLKNVEANWDLTVSALARYTGHSSSEFAVRPFITSNPSKMMSQMLTWANHEDHHVRRLASEGCRPRLPWAMALPALKKDPTPILPILEVLCADDSEYVRRSVANNLNDISKDHPDLVLKIAEKWLGEAPESQDRKRLVKHACRTLLKAGNSQALLLFGFRDPATIEVSELTLDRELVKIGEKIEFGFVVSGKPDLGKLRIEYVVHFHKKNGQLRGKIFQLSEFESGEKSRTFRRKHSFKDLSTRRHYPGAHEIAVIVNGIEKARICFELKA